MDHCRLSVWQPCKRLAFRWCFGAFSIGGTMDQLRIPLGETARIGVLDVGAYALERKVKALKRKHKALAKGQSTSTRRVDAELEQVGRELEQVRRFRNE
mgnify:CR=1 FL=1